MAGPERVEARATDGVRLADTSATWPDGGVAATTTVNTVPVMFLSRGKLVSSASRMMRWDLVQERRPWCEWTVVFAGGALVEVTQVRVESRDDVRRDLEKSGVEVLADDSRLAKRWLAVEAERERDELDWR